jgi:phosphomannomutase
VIEHILEHYAPANPKIDRTDGISLEFADWRFNLRASNTEPLLRLNIETRADLQAVQAHVKQLEEQIYFLNNQKG